MKKILLCFLIVSFMQAQSQMLKGFGDSITEATGASNEQHSFLYLLSGKLGFGIDYKKYAASASTVYLQGMPGYNFIDVSSLSLSTDPLQGYLVILYGSNSDGNNGSAEWKAQYQSIIQRFINAGYDKSKIVLCSPPYNDLFGDGIFPLADAIKEVAANLGIVYVDFATYFKQYGLETLYNSNDILHPNDKGNQVMADYIYSTIQSAGVLPIKSGSLKIKKNNDGTYTATFIASQTVNTQKFRLMYSEDGRKFQEIYIIIPEKIEVAKTYSFTFKVPSYEKN